VQEPPRKIIETIHNRMGTPKIILYYLGLEVLVMLGYVQRTKSVIFLETKKTCSLGVGCSV
jgi:hypothetical protein